MYGMPTLHWLQMASTHFNKTIQCGQLGLWCCSITTCLPGWARRIFCVTCFSNSWKTISYIRSVYGTFGVYLEPLVDELLELWTSIVAYDITKPVGFRSFMLCIVLLWTIHDFPGHGIVGGFAHHGYVGCPWCGLDTTSKPRFYDCILWLWMIKMDTFETTTLYSENGPINVDKMTGTPSRHIEPFLFPTSRFLWVLGPQLGTWDPPLGLRIYDCAKSYGCY
jgi:hypothetical protein